ncbi:MAG: hypothetical protein OEY22_09115 [Candidatus Bathyarchaeota archaeon]|nr:hypothetical protein [Candidatus Bathyarchaeota archaeon]
MKRKIILILITATLLTAFLHVTLNPLNTANATATIVQLKWVNSMAVNDMAVSKDGNYVAAVNSTGLYYFDADNENPLWRYELQAVVFRSVAISTDGDYVVAGDGDGYLHYFNQSTQRVDNQTEPTWISRDLYGPIERGTLDMSANGNYTVVGGTGVIIYYYAGCTSRTGSEQNFTWMYNAPVADFYTVHISPNGKYVAGGGQRGFLNGFVMFFKDADTATDYYTPLWFTNHTNTLIIDLALSDDGYAVAAVGFELVALTLYYWANATNLTGDPNATWTCPGIFTSIDMSASGDDVVAGGYLMPRSLHFWSDARTRNGTQSEDWIALVSEVVFDVAISDDGNIIAAPAQDEAYNNTAYFFTADGVKIGEYPLAQLSPMVSMSGDGATIAIAGPGYDSLYVFKTAVDSTPPDINDVWQQPDKENVYEEDTVDVFANITDDLSGIKQVTLNYTTGNGTWFTTTMEPYEAEIYNGTIPAFPYCTTITYIIIAEDNANNTITSQELEYTLEYHVIPEFAFATLMLLFMTATLLSVTAYKTKKKP